MKTDPQMAKLALNFYHAVLEARQEAGMDDTLLASFHGIAAVSASFTGALLGHFYDEPPFQRHVFFTGLAMKGLSVGSLGLFPGVFTREEAISAWNTCAEMLVRNPEYFLPERKEPK